MVTVVVVETDPGSFLDGDILIHTVVILRKRWQFANVY